MPDVKIDNRSSDLQRNPKHGEGLIRGGEWDLSPSDFLTNPFLMMKRFSDEMNRTWWPQVEIKQRNGDLVVYADLPGVARDNLKVEVNGDALVVRGERKQEKEQDQHGWHRTERSYGQFYRAIRLPEGVDTDKAQAQFKDGVLEVKVPLPESARRTSREIPVRT